MGERIAHGAHRPLFCRAANVVVTLVCLCPQSDGAPPSPGRASPGDGKDGNPSKYEMVEARHFNSLVSPFPIVPIALAAGSPQRCRALVQEFKSHSVSKYSPYHILDGEAYWYQHAPPAAQKHIPALISCKIQVRRGDCQAFGSRVRNACAAGSRTRHASSSWSG